MVINKVSDMVFLGFEKVAAKFDVTFSFPFRSVKISCSIILIHSMILWIVFLLCVGAFDMKCPHVDPSEEIPSFVGAVRPSDIGIVMALGDSVTAGFGINGNCYEERGKSFSIGGDKGALTFPNILKFYNPDLKGMSSGEHRVEFKGGAYNPKIDRLNGAQSSATVYDLHFQLEYLLNRINQMKKSGVDTDKQWKMITILIGGNDICRTCSDSRSSSAAEFSAALDLLVQNLHNALPRVIVNLVSLPQFQHVKSLGKHSFWCRFVHRAVSECSCLLSHGTKANIRKAGELIKAYNSEMKKIASKWQNKGYQDFSVLYHPLNEESIINSFKAVSKFDCFHPSLVSHQSIAVALWNSLLQPVSSRPTKVQLGDFNITCAGNSSTISAAIFEML